MKISFYLFKLAQNLFGSQKYYVFASWQVVKGYDFYLQEYSSFREAWQDSYLNQQRNYQEVEKEILDNQISILEETETKVCGIAIQRYLINDYLDKFEKPEFNLPHKKMLVNR